MSKSANPRLTTGAFTATGETDWLPLIRVNEANQESSNGTLRIRISGSFVATIDLQSSADDGVTFIDVVGESYTTPQDKIVEIGSISFLYRLNISAFTSGTINTVIAN